MLEYFNCEKYTKQFQQQVHSAVDYTGHKHKHIYLCSLKAFECVCVCEQHRFRFSVQGSDGTIPGPKLARLLRYQLLKEKTDYLLFKVLRVDTVSE